MFTVKNKLTATAQLRPLHTRGPNHCIRSPKHSIISLQPLLPQWHSPTTYAEYVLVLLVGRGLGRSRRRWLPLSQIRLPSRLKGKMGHTGDLGEWRVGTVDWEVWSDDMVQPSPEMREVMPMGRGERPCFQPLGLIHHTKQTEDWASPKKNGSCLQAINRAVFELVQVEKTWLWSCAGRWCISKRLGFSKCFIMLTHKQNCPFLMASPGWTGCSDLYYFPNPSSHDAFLTDGRKTENEQLEAVHSWGNKINSQPMNIRHLLAFVVLVRRQESSMLSRYSAPMG